MTRSCFFVGNPWFPKGWLGILWLVFCTSLNAQIPRLTFKHLSQEDGLSQGINAYVFKDSKGYIWISSLDGVNRFDGKQIKTYRASNDGESGPASDQLISGNFFEDQASNLWYTSHTSIQCYDRSTDAIRTFQLQNERSEWIRADYYGFYFDGKEQLWVRILSPDTTYIYRFDTRDHSQALMFSSPRVRGQRYTVIADAQQEVQQIIATLIIEEGSFKPGMEILNWSDKSIQAFYQTNGPSQRALQTHNAYVDTDQSIWLTSPEGVFRLHPEKGSSKSYSKYKGQAIKNTWSIIPYTDQYLLVSTGNLGILLFDKAKDAYTQDFRHQPQLPSSLRDNKVNELYLDDHENLWVSIWNKGLDYANLRKNKFNSLLGEPGEEKKIFSITELPNGDMLCGTTMAHGVYRFDAQKNLVQQIPILPLDPQLSIAPSTHMRFLFADSKGRIWLLYQQYLALYQEGQTQFQTVLQAEGVLRHMLELDDGRIILSATEAGIYLLDTEKFELKPIKGLPTFQSEIYAMYKSRSGHLLLAENGEGLQLLRPEGENWQMEKSIPGLGNCMDFWEPPDREEIWIASSTGLLCLNGPQFKVTRINQAGMASEWFYSILPSRDGDLWLSSNNGLVRYNPATEQHHRYKKIDGLQGNEFNNNAFCQSSNGELWFGGFKGVNVFHPEKIEPLPYLPNIQITHLTVNDEEEQKRYLGNWSLEHPIRFAYSENTLSFDFVALEYSDVEKNQFRYRMKGLDKGWVNGSNRGFARYANMPPGEYAFELRASNSDGLWQESPRRLSVIIAKPFWQEWWFYLLCLLLISALIYAIFQYRLQQALKLERMRVKISSDLHDDVGGLLSGLAMQSELLELSVSEQHKTKLRHISELSRSAMSRMRDTVWAIDARKDKIKDLIDRMRDHANELLVPKDIHFDLQVQQLNIEQKLSANYRQNIYLIYKEAITNIAKHSNGHLVEVQLNKKGKGLEMLIRDNGQIDPSKIKSSGLGLSNMQMRAEQIGAIFNFFPEKDGFKIRLNIERLD
ncbi:MAG: triple tyrosine motif-containing protein [Bacteroidota bacterium]